MMVSDRPTQPAGVEDTLALPAEMQQQETGEDAPCHGRVEVVSPGFVIIRGLLGPTQQKWLARYALSAGQDEARGHSFWVNMGSQRVLNSDVGRGRIYDDIETFPSADTVRVCPSFGEPKSKSFVLLLKRVSGLTRNACCVSCSLRARRLCDCRPSVMLSCSWPGSMIPRCRSWNRLTCCCFTMRVMKACTGIQTATRMTETTTIPSSLFP